MALGWHGEVGLGASGGRVVGVKFLNGLWLRGGVSFSNCGDWRKWGERDLCCIALHCIVLHGILLYYVTLHCNTLQYRKSF